VDDLRILPSVAPEATFAFADADQSSSAGRDQSSAVTTMSFGPLGMADTKAGLASVPCGKVRQTKTLTIDIVRHVVGGVPTATAATAPAPAATTEASAV
jgi:hypothetical protein